MTRQELEERLLDYLYDELGPSERAAFERALPQHPELAREVMAHQATRRAFQTLPREAVPAGLLNEVLAEADKEAARRGQSAEVMSPVTQRRGVAESVEGSSPGFWERLRRLLFQPAFAMAMVVAVVAGVSIVGSKKGELPGMSASNEAQHLPPVPVVMAERRAAEAAADSPLAPAAAPSRDAPAAATPELAAEVDLLPLSKDEEAAPSGQKAAEGPPKALSGAKADDRQRGFDDLDGERGEVWNQPETTAAPAKSGVGGRALEGQQEERSGAAGEELAKPAERKEPAGAVPGFAGDLAEDKTVAAPETRDARLDEEPRAKPDKVATEPPPKDVAPVVTKPATVPANDFGSQPPPGPKAPDEADKSKSDAPTRESPPAEPARVTTTEQATRTPTPDIDDDRKEAGKASPSLTPPAPTPDKVWATYQQQMAAGALADAERSVEALAKLEGESARVRQARAEVKKRIEAQKQSTTPSKIPPDPPVQPPK